MSRECIRRTTHDLSSWPESQTTAVHGRSSFSITRNGEKIAIRCPHSKHVMIFRRHCSGTNRITCITVTWSEEQNTQTAARTKHTGSRAWRFLMPPKSVSVRESWRVHGVRLPTVTAFYGLARNPCTQVPHGLGTRSRFFRTSFLDVLEVLQKKKKIDNRTRTGDAQHVL